MPKRKRLPELSGKMLVQKTNPLLTLSETKLTLPELKILDAYLARIDSHNPEKCLVTFEKGQLEELLDVTQIRPDDLDKRISNLFQTVKIKDDRKFDGFKRVSLFDKAECYRDEKSIWTVKLKAGESAMEYIFNPENLGYLRYRLKNVVELTSRYSYILYLYLEKNLFRKTWEINLDDLKELLQCATVPTYTQYKHFNNLVLKKCQKEINEKTDLQFLYEPIREGRRTHSLQITCLKTGSLKDSDVDEDVDPNQVSIADVLDIEPQGELWEDTVAEFNFSKEELDAIRGYLNTMPYSKLPQSQAALDAPELMKHDYMDLKVSLMNFENKKKPIKNKFAYLLKIVQNDANQA